MRGSKQRKASPYEPFAITLPAGFASNYAMAWIRGSSVLWVADRGGIRRIIFSDPANVQEQRFEPNEVSEIPDEWKELLQL